MFKNKFLIILGVLLLLIPMVSAIDAKYPELTGYVTDNANIIDSEYEQKITDLADKINKQTTVEIAVLTIESLGEDNIDNYAVQTFRQNGVGKKDNNNGLLILVSKNDRKYRFEVGYGLESTVTDSMKVPIGEKIIVPNFKQGQYGKGIYDSMIVIEGLATNNTEVLSKYGIIETSSSGGGGGSGDGGFIIILFIGIMIVAIFFFMVISSRSGNVDSTPSIPTTYKPPPYTYSGRSSSSSSSSSSTTRRRSSSSYNSSSHGHRSGGGSSFKGFGGGRSGGGGFGGGW